MQSIFVLVFLVLRAQVAKCSDDITLSSLQATVQEQASTIQMLQSELTATKNSLTTANSRLTSVEGRLKSVEDSTSHAVSFTVRFSTDPVQVGTHGTLKFDHYVTNIGGGYDSLTGIFIARVSGLYVFFFTVMSNNGQWFESSFVKEGQAMDAAHAGSADAHTFYDQGSMLTTVHLDIGQRVWIQQVGGSESFRGGPWTVYSGFLLKAQ